MLEAIDTVAEWGVDFVDPRLEEGKAKIASEEAIVADVARAAGEQPLAGKQIVVTAGATSESIDPVRVLTNRSSGKMGRAVAKACYVRGADVTLVQQGSDVPYADVQQVESATEMLEATQEACQSADTLVSAAAIGDYTVEPSDEKIRSGQHLTLDLEPAPKLIDEVRQAQPRRVRRRPQRIGCRPRWFRARTGSRCTSAGSRDALRGSHWARPRSPTRERRLGGCCSAHAA